MTTEESRKYILSDAELLSYSARLLNYLRRDIADFIIFGITPAKIEEFEAQRLSFSKIPSDALSGMEATLAKEARKVSREHLITEMSNVALRFALAFGDSHTKLRELEVDKLAQQSDEILANRARHIAASIDSNAAEIEDYGQTEEMTTKYKAAVTDFEAKVIFAQDADDQRLKNTAIRVSKGNELYDKVLNFTNIGKKVYRKKDTLKFSNYVIYGSGAPVSVHGAPANLRFNGTEILEWDEIDNAVSYAVAISTDNGISWQKDIATSENSIKVTREEGKYLYKVRGRNAKGLGEYSEVLEKEFELVV